MMTILFVMAGFLIFMVTVLAVVMLRLRATRKGLATEIARADAALQEIAQLRDHYSPITSLEDEQGRLGGEIASQEAQMTELRATYQEKKAIYDRMLAEIAVFDERLAFAEMGVYEPHFEFTDSEEYKAAILRARETQKQLVTAKTAVFCTTNWTVDGSKAKGEAMTNRNIRLTLRAFNNECDAAIANTRWNNVNAMEKRIVRAREQIEKLNASNAIKINDIFLQLKLEELFLTHEHREKLKAEREERAETMRLAREEQRLLRDIEEAEEQEARYIRLLDKAKAEAADIVGPQLNAYSQQIAELEKDLAAAHAKVVRAQALAERTRSGYVYIISNIGSFGDGVVKIGLTRRLDPIDRVRELGDASVPFTFDVHAIIYSDDAPALERALHGEFESTRINAQNYRKEFFRAAINDVEEAVKRLAPAAPFFRDVEAQEYRETLSRRQLALAQANEAQEVFPETL